MVCGLIVWRIPIFLPKNPAYAIGLNLSSVAICSNDMFSIIICVSQNLLERLTDVFLGEKVVKLFAQKQEDNNVIFTRTGLNEKTKQMDDLLALQKLIDEEAKLIEDKQNWVTLRKSLQKKAKEEIEIRKNNSMKLKNEITDLKEDCETLTKSLNLDAKTQ